MIGVDDFEIRLRRILAFPGLTMLAIVEIPATARHLQRVSHQPFKAHQGNLGVAILVGRFVLRVGRGDQDEVLAVGLCLWLRLVHFLDDETDFLKVLGNVIVGLLSLRSIKASNEESLLALGGFRESSLGRRRIVGARSHRLAQCPTDACIEEFHANPPVGQVWVFLRKTMHFGEIVKGRVLNVEAHPTRWSHKAAIHRDAFFVREDACVSRIALCVHDDVRTGVWFAPSKVLG